MASWSSSVDLYSLFSFFNGHLCECPCTCNFHNVLKLIESIFRYGQEHCFDLLNNIYMTCKYLWKLLVTKRQTWSINATTNTVMKSVAVSNSWKFKSNGRPIIHAITTQNGICIHEKTEERWDKCKQVRDLCSDVDQYIKLSIARDAYVALQISKELNHSFLKINITNFSEDSVTEMINI